MALVRDTASSFRGRPGGQVGACNLAPEASPETVPPFPGVISPTPESSSQVHRCGELFQAWEMWLRPYLEKPVGSKAGRQDPRPRIDSPVGNQACIVSRLLWDLLLLKLPHPEASKCLLSIFIFLKSGLDLPGIEHSRLDHFSLYIANILL